MDQVIIVLYARPWSLVDERTNQPKSGTTVQYVAGDSLAPKLDTVSMERGYNICKESVSNDLAAKLSNVPGIYSASFSMRAKQGKNVLSISDLSFISDL